MDDKGITMKKPSILIEVLLVLISFLSINAYADEKILTQDELRVTIPGSTARHWYLDHERWYVISWNRDGTLSVNYPDAAADAKPVETGKWWIKEVEAKKGETPESVKQRNAELDYLYCQQFDKWRSNHELCFELVQVTFNKMPGSDIEEKTQEYKYYREAGAETGAFILTTH